MQSRKTGDVTMQPKGVAAETDTSQTCNKMIGFYHFNVIFTGHQIRMFTFIHYLQICSCMLAQNKSTHQLYDMRRSASSRKNIYSIHFFLTQYIWLVCYPYYQFSHLIWQPTVTRININGKKGTVRKTEKEMLVWKDKADITTSLKWLTTQKLYLVLWQSAV